MHMRGNLSGSINGISVDERRFSVFGDVPSKTTYIALDPVFPSVSVLLRVLTPMLSTLGYLFAHPGEGVGNGFSFLGDNFLRRSQVTFETGKGRFLYIYLRQHRRFSLGALVSGQMGDWLLRRTVKVPMRQFFL